MRLDARARLSLLAIAVAVALLVAGLAGPIRRAFDERTPVGTAELAGEQVRDDARRQQREVAYRQLVERDCTEAVARAGIGRILAGVAPDVGPPGAPQRVVRFDGERARSIVMARMRDVPKPPGDWIDRMREANRARVLADYLDFVFSSQADDAVCVWHAEGERKVGTDTLLYAMDVWLAPTPELDRLAADPAAYLERPR